MEGSNCASALKVRQGRAGEFSVRVHDQDSAHELLSTVVKSGGVAETVKAASDHGAVPRNGWLERLEREVLQYSSRWVDFGFTSECASSSESSPAVLRARTPRTCVPVSGGGTPVFKVIDCNSIERGTQDGGLIYRARGHRCIYLRQAKDSSAASTGVVADLSFRKDIAGEVIEVDSNVWRGCADLDLER
ncbi:MAG: hypothetical protein OSA11_09205 [Candidatus Nanopelagicales bacterium]|nr:hypothetical protein [Candidatus Nanopelagicales bacterium]